MPERPVVLVDQDGPLAAFDSRFWEVCAAEGIELDCAPSEQRHRFATDHIPDRHQRARARALVDSAGWFADLPVVDGAVEGLQALAEVADCWVVSKPLDANPTCRDDKAAWLERHFGPEWAARLILAPDKSLVVGHLLLDDAPKPAWFARAHWSPVIFATSWNGPGSKWGHLPRWDWGDGIDTLLQNVWRRW